MAKVKEKKAERKEAKAKKPRGYRKLKDAEVEMLFAFYEKWNGNMRQMSLDRDVPFNSYAQVHHYCTTLGFEDKLVQIRIKRQAEVKESLQDAKTLAIENAMRILKRNNVFVYNRSGMQVFDKNGDPLIVEKLPYYKEIKAAWEIIKTELGEPTNITKSDLTSGGLTLGEILDALEKKK